MEMEPHSPQIEMCWHQGVDVQIIRAEPAIPDCLPCLNKVLIALSTSHEMEETEGRRQKWIPWVGEP